MASLIRWTWVWASSWSWWCTGKPGMLQSVGLQRVWTRLRDWTELRPYLIATLRVPVLFCFVFPAKAKWWKYCVISCSFPSAFSSLPLVECVPNPHKILISVVAYTSLNLTLASCKCQDSWHNCGILPLTPFIPSSSFPEKAKYC